MAVPGLQLKELNESDDVSIHELKRGHEWRFEVPFGVTVEVKLLTGTAEIFGTELPIGNKFSFTGIKAAVYTWHGCSIECKGKPAVEYTAEESPMTAYTNLHFALEKLREDCKTGGQGQEGQGPRVMIIGPEDAGKTSLVKVLTAYAVRNGRRPVVVNLDTREGLLSLPGTLTATSFSTIMDVEEGFGTSPTSGPSPVPVKLPLVYYYGFDSPDSNQKLYKKLTSRLALAVTSKLGEDSSSQASGLIIDTPGTLSNPSSYDLIQHLVADFSITVLIVLGSERLYSDMVRRYDTSSNTTSTTSTAPNQPLPITVIKLPKSGGCVDRSPTHLLTSRQTAVREYFFGEPKRTLSPYTVTVDFGSILIYKLTSSSSYSAAENNHLLPGGASSDDPSTSSFLNTPLLERVEPSSLMLNSVLAVMLAELSDSVDVIAESSVMGFVYVADVEDGKRRLKILAPVAGRLPSRPFVWGSWPEATLNLVG